MMLYRLASLVAALVLLPPLAAPRALLSLPQTQYTVQEGQQFSVRISKVGTSATQVNVVLQIQNSALFGGADFIGMSEAGVIPAGPDDVLQGITFTVRDDTIPEPDETFAMELLVTNGDGYVGTPNIAMVTIVANDNGFGVFGFINPGPVYVQEARTDSPVTLAIQRRYGTYDTIVLNYQVSGGGPGALSPADLSPQSGAVVFLPGEAIKQLPLTVMADQIPEIAEQFHVRLVSTQGGVSVSPSSNRPVINSSESEAIVIVTKNDAPIRFSQAEYQVREGQIDTELKVTVLRGLDDAGADLGPINTPATVNYYFVSVTASLNADYLGANGSLSFSPGTQEVTISLQILPDVLPEISEELNIVLEDPNGDVVLVTPSVTTIIILANDDYNGVLSLRAVDGSIPPFVHVNEDSAQYVTQFSVVRQGGTFGAVSVQWLMERNSSSYGPSGIDISPTVGTVSFSQGDTEKQLIFNVVQENIPEPAERFTLRLLAATVTGGAKVEGALAGTLVIEDSDSVYGSVQFTADSAQSIVTTSSPRRLALSLVRQGGTMGDLAVHYDVSYWRGGRIYTGIVLSRLPGVAMFPAGQSSHVVEVLLRDEAFLQVGARFVVTLSSVDLSPPAEVAPYNTPKLGAKVSTTVRVTVDEANGEVGFGDATNRLVAEPNGPDGMATQVALLVTRVGTNGDVTVNWTLTGAGPNADHLTKTDIRPTSGTLSMLSGQSSANILLEVLADAEAETDEEAVVALSDVWPPDTQRLRPGASSIRLVIGENDSPGGVFEFAQDVQATYTVQEEVDALQLVVERHDGALVDRSIEYYIQPNGQAEFYGDTNVVRFPAGMVQRTLTVVARGDNVPELAETFQLRLRSFGPRQANIGAHSVVNITVESNDQPYGLFQFPSDNYTVTVDESKGASVRLAYVSVERAMGRFGTASVDWHVVDAQNNTDLAPLGGTVVFPPGVGKVDIEVIALPDMIPEGQEEFYINLTSPTGGAQLGDVTMATLVINKNDDAVFFKAPAVVSVPEGGSHTFTVTRAGSAALPAAVRCRTVDAVAAEGGRDYIGIHGLLLEFAVGETEGNVTVEVLDDFLPEPDEVFYLELYDTQGDIAVYGTPRATVIIQASDNSNGIFRFTPPYSLTREEGKPAQFELARDRGHFGPARVYYEILANSTGEQVSQGQDFPAPVSWVTFKDLQQLGALVVTATEDEIPEYLEVFTIRLLNVTGGPEWDPGQLADVSQEVQLEVLQNDDPFGVFKFPRASREVSVAEDYYPGDSATARADIIVARAQGAYTTVQVLWEVFSQAVAVSGNLPVLVDLLFVSPVPPNVTSVPARRRPGTGTAVLQFDGCDTCYLTVPPASQPEHDDVDDGFSLSAWVQGVPNTDGYILAKTSPGGARHHYGLKLKTERMGGYNSATLQFRYSVTGNPSNLVEAKALAIDLCDGAWHFLLVCVDAGQVSFYVDGISRGNSPLEGQYTQDVAGELLVGAIAPGVQRFEGLLQDVRVYSRKLAANEINELYMTPSVEEVAPISGVLTFTEMVREGRVTLYSLQDQEEEANEIFAVKLISATGGASISEDDHSSTLTVLKSDNANGLFGLSGECLPAGAVGEAAVVGCPVARRRGDADTVTVGWQVLQQGGSAAGQIATTDFINATGELVFIPGERLKTLTVEVLDDELPELAEQFTVVLVWVESADGVLGTTNTSGVSLDPGASSSSLTVGPSDYPYGLMQFAVHAQPPTQGGPLVPPATTQPLLTVPEEAGMLTLLVVRAQGSLGEVMVEWRTRDGTAKSSGRTPSDFVAQVDRLVFQPGQRWAEVQVQVIDNSIPEPEKRFTVELLNPTGGAAVGVGSTLTVLIRHSDQAHGVFLFHDSSLYVLTHETGDTDFDKVNLKVIRAGGAIGPANVTWGVTSDPGNDLIANSGHVLFEDGQKEAEITLRVRGDTIPELDETFVVRLLDTSAGTLGDEGKINARLVVRANDDPYGTFIIAAQDRPVRVDEANTMVSVTIMRRPLSGTFGTVRVDLATLAPWETYPFLPGGTSRATYTDFVNTTGSVILPPHSTSAVFNITIRDDQVPEVDETVFVRLTGVVLVQGGQDGAALDSPRLGEPTETYAQIIINQNDRPNGVLQLSTDSVIVNEDFEGNLVSVVRTAGAFGAVSVKFEVVPINTTYGLDYSVSSTDVVLVSGERTKRIPVEIIDDRIPELTEGLVVRLVDAVTGGAVLGELTRCTVLILPSDDPHGAFGFESPTLTTAEGLVEAGVTVEIPVMRTGGTMGVVEVQWAATDTAGGAVTDISPVSGSVGFVSNEARQMIRVTVLPDDIPEGLETMTLTLLSADGGGRILDDHSNFTLHILPNDNPHGAVEFAKDEFVVFERSQVTTQAVEVIRRGGSYGQLRVFYSLSELDLVQEATRGGGTVLAYYAGPRQGKPLPMAGTNYGDLTGQRDPLTACATFCLLTPQCEAFDYSTDRVDCNWFTSGDYSFLDNRTGYSFYLKQQDKTAPLYSQVARTNEDFQQIQGASIIIPDGATSGSIPVTILPDTLPELLEKFTATLTQVELLDRAPISPAEAPRLGTRQRAYVTIASNDDANGVFRIYSKDPRAIDDGQTVLVAERAKFSIELLVERQGGSIAEVTVTWVVNMARSTATKGADYIADGATLTFPPGHTQRTVTIGVEDDLLPETDELVIVDLVSPTGGAVLGDRSSVTIIITANDYVAGLLSFSNTAYLVQEGGPPVQLLVRRSPLALGQVTVDWAVEAVSSAPPQQRFRVHSGTLFFDEGETEKEILLHLIVDNEPKINQEYNVKLVNVRTVGVRDTGAAAVDPQRAVATVTIEGGHDPHGVVSIAPASRELRVTEDSGVVNLSVVRKFGSIGIVRVYYTVKEGVVNALSADMLARAGLDFTDVTDDVITLYDGESSVSLLVTVLDDTTPEVDEVFLVVLTRVELVEPLDSTFRPRLASSGTVAEVIIEANDGTQGEVIFPPESASLRVDEFPMNISVRLLRRGGVFGDVSVFLFGQSAANGAKRERDFRFPSGDVMFAAGQSEQTVTVEILQDTAPEPDESFEIVMASPKGGLVLGEPHKAIITIMANDEANGIVTFQSAANITLNEPGATGSTASSTALVQVVRAPGYYGVVTVPFSVLDGAGREAAADIRPATGAVIFQDKQASVLLELAVVADDEPEEAEVFTLVLGPPDGGATLGLNVRKTVIVERNDAPYGLLNIYPAGSRNTSVAVEEDARTVALQVVRSQGSQGQVSVNMVTVAGTARSLPGNTMMLAVIDKIPSVMVTSWYSYAAHGQTYGLLLSRAYIGPMTSHLGSDGSAPAVLSGAATPSALYRWQGVMRSVQTMETDGARAAAAFTEAGQTYLCVANHGSHNRYTAKSRLYRVGQNERLNVMQEFSTRGATSVVHFTSGRERYMFLTNYQDSRGTTRVASDLYHWEAGNARFTALPTQYVDTTGAASSTSLTIGGQVYLVVANQFDSDRRAYSLRSVVFKLAATGQLVIHQHLDTHGAAALASFRTPSNSYLLVANQQGDTPSAPQGVAVYSWNSLTQNFMLIQQLPVEYPTNVHMFKYQSKDYAAVTSRTRGASIYQWEDSTGQFNVTWSPDWAHYDDLYPIIVNQPVGELVVMATAPSSNGSLATGAELFQVAVIGASDYVPRRVTLSFEPGQTHLAVGVEVVADLTPEDTETFSVRLEDPRRGAELGPQAEVTVSILSNDNGHGIVQFADDSLLRYEDETPGADNVVVLNVLRGQGTSGRVVVRWRATGAHRGVYDLSPVDGQVEFADGQAAATISLTVRDDGEAEADEVTLVELVQVMEGGTRLPGRGARLGANRISRLTVLANDSPYGVVAWEQREYSVREPDSTDTAVTLHLVRHQGTQGSLKVTYMTTRATSLPWSQQAVSGEDYVETHRTVDIPDGETRVGIDIAILADTRPEVMEVFWVNVTMVTLTTPLPVGEAGPSVRRPGDVAAVSILENDNARGQFQFNVTRNMEGRVDVHEGVGRVRLGVARTPGSFGAAEVSWQAVPLEADTQDFSPSSGVLRFTEGVTQQHIDLLVTDDNLPENLETFEVRLVRVTAGGGTLGPDAVVRVGIVKNDSPTGEFSLSPLKLSVRESVTPGDPEGAARFEVVRGGGTDGQTTVQWRLDPRAVSDFDPPLTGTITFSAGESLKPLTLRTTPDQLVEGEETYTLSLVAADNNADISPTAGDAIVTILADPGAGGLVGIAPDSRAIVMGEPQAGYDGRADVVVVRSAGSYGNVKITWQIVKRDLAAFVQTQGEVTLEDGQATTVITIECGDDIMPELRQEFTLELTSATGGARIDESSMTASITVVASDYPYGLFEFGEPSQVTVSEDSQQVAVAVVRAYGSVGQVRVSYTTHPGTAGGDAAARPDYRDRRGTLTYSPGQQSQLVTVTLLNDQLAEGPETFYVNITGVQLLIPTSLDLTSVGGLQLDMPPAVGPLAVKTVIIDKNDEAEGSVQFAAEAINFQVREEVGVARVPVTRGPGTFGTVRATYRAYDVTARSASDYRLPEGDVIFPDGVAMTTINVTILDDELMEFDEQLRLELVAPGPGTRLGALTSVTLTILKSDYPNGEFSWRGRTVVSLANPASPTALTVSLQRTGGLTGQQQVMWRIMGPNDPRRVLQETNDLGYVSGGREVTAGALTWGDQQGGAQALVINIKPHSGWEVSKTYVFVMYDIIGTPAAGGHGEVSRQAGNLTLTIEKFGHPNGIVRFDSQAQTDQSFTEPPVGGTVVVFPIRRREGTIGTVTVFWRVVSPTDPQKNITDVSPASGTAEIRAGQAAGQVALRVMADDVPELDEVLRLELFRVEGGAEIDTQYNTSRFKIRYNDFPHGRVGLLADLQAVVVDASSLRRQLRLNITRHDGSHGRLRVSFAMVYDQAEPGMSYVPSTGSALFNDSVREAVFYVDIESHAFLLLNSTFTVTLTDLTYIGVGVTILPELVAGETIAMVRVPQAAANTEFGFKDPIVNVDEETLLARVTLYRRGSYGSVSAQWVAGFPTPELPDGYRDGTLTPNSGSVALINGQDSYSFTIQIVPHPEHPALFGLHLPAVPQASALGGARLWAGHTLCRVEPYGVVRFAAESRDVAVREDSTKDVEVTLYVERVFGSQDGIQIRYQTVGGTAAGGADYRQISSGAITMDRMQTSSSIFVQILADSTPETDEHFFVNFTSVTRLPTAANQGASPRLSTLYSAARVTVRSNSDPYGVVSLRAGPAPTGDRTTEPGTATVTVTRTGGTFGAVAVEVRTVGGGETWDRLIATSPGVAADTIGQALAARDASKRAIAGVDYQITQTTVNFQEGESEKTVQLVIVDDVEPEGDEEMFVYLSTLTDGVRVAQPSRDQGRKGYVKLTISRNDFWNGWVGFYPTNSSAVSVSEDTAHPHAALTIERRNASFDRLEVYWRARVAPGSDLTESSRVDLITELVATSGRVQCAAGDRLCHFGVPLQQDTRPENATWFVVELYLPPSEQIRSGALIDPQRRLANVTVEASDHPNGLLQFDQKSRLVYMKQTDTSVTLTVQRLGYHGKVVMVTYATQQAVSKETMAGVTVYNALEGADYNQASGQLTLSVGQQSTSIKVTLDPFKASDQSYPKLFRVVLSSPTDLATLGERVAVVTIVSTPEVAVWGLWPQVVAGPLTNDSIDSTMRQLNTAIQQSLSPDELVVTKGILDRVLDTADTHQLRPGARSAIWQVMCSLLDPTRKDATRGHWQLSRQVERFAYSYVSHLQCFTCCQETFLQSPTDCPHVHFSVAKRYPEQINGYKWPARGDDTFEVPPNLLRVQDHGRRAADPRCYPVAFVEYSSEQWFTATTDNILLNHKVISAGVKGQGSRFLDDPVKFRIHTPLASQAAKRAECVYFDEDAQRWTTGMDVCLVTNNLELALDNHVDCACKHMSLYAVRSHDTTPGLIGYPVWFHVSCFICITGMALAILAHHVCAIRSMFAANLLMHMCFAVMATEICYVIDAFLSRSHLLSVGPEDSNYRCIVMSLFLHYFFLAQFTWMMTQAVNLFKVLVMNDEHTERKYLTFFMLGWGLPAFIVVVFYVITYVIYRFVVFLPDAFIYGDVSSRNDICFVTNPYAALAGVVGPVLIVLMVLGAVFIQAFQVQPQWHAYDDVYRGRYNIHEVRAMLLFWACITLTWLWGGLHMAYGQLWLFILFCIFNIITGLYAFIVYAVLRNPWLPCFRPQKAEYAINTTISEGSEFNHPTVHPTVYPPQTALPPYGSIRGSHASLIQEHWEEPPTAPVTPHLRVKRSPAAVNGNVYVIPPNAYDKSAAGLDDNTQDLDDLIYALKTGATLTTPSDSGHLGDHDGTLDGSSPGSQVDRKRINIADTHL